MHDLKDLIGSSVTATDGEMGKVRDFLFDDHSWLVSYFVVDVGTWFKRRDVVLPVASAEHLDWTEKVFRVRMTREQGRHSPDIDTEKPVSRQQEIAMKEYWGKMAYWFYAEMEGGLPIPTGRKLPVRTEEDPDLRSVWGMTDYKVWATDGEIGRLEGFILDGDPWHLAYLDVKAEELLLDRFVLIPTSWVKSVCWAECRVNLHHSRSGL